LVRDLDPTIERAILRCLERNPAKRPSSALAVSAALPGGDQLAAALAAGETPSPEMVAAAGEQSAIQPAVGLALVRFTIAMVGVLAIVSERYNVVHRVPLPRSTDSLKDRAQETLERIGYPDPPADAVWGWSPFSRAYLADPNRARAADDQWPALASGRTGTAGFWSRTSPLTMVPSFAQMLPTKNDPPMTLSDMRYVKLDPNGRLVEFQSLPPQVDAAPEGGAPRRDVDVVKAVDWQPLFDAAALPMASFHEVPSQWRPRGDADRRTAWEGPLPDLPGTTARVEAASIGDRPVAFVVVTPWTQPTRMASSRRTISLSAEVVTAIGALVGLATFALAAFLARRNLRSGHGDRRGAFRTAALVFICQALAYAIRARH